MSTRNRPVKLYERDGNDEATDLRPRKSLNVEIRDVNSPSPARARNAKHGASPRVAFNRTSTLKGAYESIGTPPDNENSGDAKRTRTSPKYAIKRSPRSDRASPSSRVSPGTYRRFNDADSLADLDGDPLSPSPNTRQRYNVDNLYRNDTFDFADYAMEERVDTRRAQHEVDQQRLRRVTERDTPVLSKANVGRKGKERTEDLPRQTDGEEFGRHFEPMPSLNIPPDWGKRGKNSRNLFGKMNRENEENYLNIEREQPRDQEWDYDIDFTARSLQMSNSPPVRNRIQSREVQLAQPVKAETSPRTLDQVNGVAQQSAASSFASEGNPIPNTPIVVYPNSTTRGKPRTMHRDDSQSLLRKLARKESPSLTNSATPEQKSHDDTISNMKTPVVMGAWIDTPAPDRTANEPEPVPASDITAPTTKTDNKPVQVEPQRPPPAPQVSPQKSSPKQAKAKLRPVRRTRVELEKPQLPKSALDAVIQDAKTGQDQSFLVGENTIDSLQDLLQDDSSVSEFKDGGSSGNERSASEKESDGKDGRATLPKADEALIDRLNGKLLSLVSNIKEVRDGLTGLETQAAKDAKIMATQGKRPSKQSHSCRRGAICEACGLAGDRHRYVALPIPALWRRSPDTRRIRPTLLGWFLLIFLTWYISEMTMCEMYCHPLSLSPGTDFVIDPNAPRIPWVLPTMLWRWSHLSTIFAPIWAIIVAVFRFIAQMFGFWDGFVDTPTYPRPSRGPILDDVAASYERARSGYAPRYENPPIGGVWEQGDAEQDLSMQGDEIL